MKNPLTPAGIEPATFQFVAQHLIRGPPYTHIYIYIYIYIHVCLCVCVQVRHAMCMIECKYLLCNVSGYNGVTVVQTVLLC